MYTYTVDVPVYRYFRCQVCMERRVPEFVDASVTEFVVSLDHPIPNPTPFVVDESIAKKIVSSLRHFYVGV